MPEKLNRREFVAVTAGGLIAAPTKVERRNILNFNENMEYRRLGKTGLMVSAVCMGGHWKRLGPTLGRTFHGTGYDDGDMDNIKSADFLKNRDAVISHAIANGINYVDACAPPEVLAYSRVLKGRRDKIYFGYSWHLREPRYPEWRDAKKLVSGLEAGLKEAGLDYVDLWRITLPQDGIPDLGELLRVEEATIAGLALARKQGKARFTGVSSHNRIWLKSVIEQYPEDIQVVLTPYTAGTKELPDDSIFDAIRTKDVGVFGIKPFADNSLFKGDSSPSSPVSEEDDRRARLAIRCILGNPAITAPIAGMANTHQVDNVVKAVGERRKLDTKERTELDQAVKEMWAKVGERDHKWLKNWEYV